MSKIKNTLALLNLLGLRALRRLSRVPGFRKMASEALIFFALKALKYREWQEDVQKGVKEQRAVDNVVRTVDKIKNKKKRKTAKKSRKRNRK